MHVRAGVINNMLRNISDPKLRQTYAQIINGNFPFKVYCMNPQGNMHEAGLLIGYIRQDGRTIEEPTKDKNGVVIAALITGRDRFDGRKGFRCECGNSSIIAKEEAGIVAPGWFPNRADMAKIAARIQRRGDKATAFVFGNSQEYEGFRVEAVTE